MAQLEVLPDAAAQRQVRVRSRLRRLAVMHALLATVPTAVCFVPAYVTFLPLLWALESVQLGQMMLLGFWAGMGAGRIVWRTLLASLACVYLAIWPTLGYSLSRASMQESAWTDSIGEFCTAVVLKWTIVALLAAAFLVVRRWFSELRSAPEADDRSSSGRVQYSILGVLVVTAVIALLLALIRIARPASHSEWQIVASTVLAFVALLIDALCAVWAILAAGRVRWRVFLVFLVAALLGVALSITAGHANLSWWLVPGWVIAWILPIGVAVASLGVVRNCGYRLVSKRAAGAS